MLESASKQPYEITERGRELLQKAPSLITLSELRRYPEFEDFIRLRCKKPNATAVLPTALLTDSRTILPTILPENAIGIG